MSTEIYKGTIGEYYENDIPVIVKFANEFPEFGIRSKLPMLTVISWKYDGSKNNGMPERELSSKMMSLESAITNISANYENYKHAYSRTGNHIKELVYYSSSKEKFMKIINESLATHERYPIEINFYEDNEWMELQKILMDFEPKE